MSYTDALARLKQSINTGEVDPTKPSKPGFVGFVGATPPCIGKKNMMLGASSNEDNPYTSLNCATPGARRADQALLRTLGYVVDDLPLTAQAVYAELSETDIAAWQVNEIITDHLRAFALALNDGQEREAGLIPAPYEYKAVCQRCGPVWLFKSGNVLNCPWCINRYNGWPIPRPG